MASSPRQQSKPSPGRRARRHLGEPAGIPVGCLCLTILLYAAAGTILATFPVSYWIWNLALGGTIAQALAMAGPRALSRLRWWSANVLALLAILGTGALVVALSIALGYVGTDSLDDVVLEETAFEVIRVSLLALIVAALGAVTSAETGDRLLKTYNRLQSTVILAATCITGLVLGALVGLLIRR